MTYEENIKEQIESYIRDSAPSSAIDHAETFGYLKGLLDSGITQAIYSGIVGINDRTLREYINKHKKEYDEMLEQGKADADDKVDPANINTRLMSEEQIDAFVSSLYTQAIKGSARDRQLLIDFTGMTANDVLGLQKSKETSLRWFIKANLSYIKKAVDTRDLGIQISESPYLYRGDKESSENKQTFVNLDLSEEAFKLELMYWGMVFMQIYNDQAHPDAELLSTALRISRLEDGTAQPINKTMAKRYAEGVNITKKDKAVNPAELRAKLLEVFDPDKVEQMLLDMQGAKNVTKAPEIDPVRIKQRATDLQDELEVLLTTQEEMQKIFNTKLKDKKERE